MKKNEIQVDLHKWRGVDEDWSAPPLCAVCRDTMTTCRAPNIAHQIYITLATTLFRCEIYRYILQHSHLHANHFIHTSHRRPLCCHEPRSMHHLSSSHFYVRYQDGGGHNYNDCNCHFGTATIQDKSEKWLFRFPQIHTPLQLHLEFYLNFAYFHSLASATSHSQTFALRSGFLDILANFQMTQAQNECTVRMRPLLLSPVATSNCNTLAYSCRSTAATITNSSTSSSYLVFLTNAFGVRLSVFEILRTKRFGFCKRHNLPARRQRCRCASI